jgi:hypothetical protein
MQTVNKIYGRVSFGCIPKITGSLADHSRIVSQVPGSLADLSRMVPQVPGSPADHSRMVLHIPGSPADPSRMVPHQYFIKIKTYYMAVLHYRMNAGRPVSVARPDRVKNKPLSAASQSDRMSMPVSVIK